MPIIKLETREAWPEELRDLVKESEAGGFELNVVPKTKLDEFRDTNINVSKEREAAVDELKKLKAIIPEGTDYDEFRTQLADLQAMAQRVADGELSENGDIEAEVAKRTERMKRELEDQKAAALGAKTKAEERAQEAEGKFKNLILKQAVIEAAMDPETGANPEAVDYILADAQKVFTFDESDTLIPRKGDSVLYGSDGATPMSMKVWVTDLVSTKPLLAKPSGGGGDKGDPTKKFGGYTQEEYRKLTPMQKMELANKGSTSRR
jgi:hypothetical protein